MAKKQLIEPQDKLCEVDKLRLDHHPRCSYCYILVGPGHWETRLAGQVHGKPICGSCREMYHTRPECFRREGLTEPEEEVNL